MESLQSEPNETDGVLVTVGRYLNLAEALLAKAALDSAAIECFLADDNMNRLYFPNATGGARLEVAAKDEAQALTMLNSPILERFEVEGSDVYDQPRCVHCGSLKVSYVADEAGGPQVGWKCDDCDCEWSLDEEDRIADE